MQHFLVLGARGSGKSTLLKRIEYEVIHQPKLAKRYLVVNLPEEQSSIYRLFDLWDAVIQELEVAGVMKNTEPAELPDDNTQYARERFGLIQTALKENKKELIILLDNVDRILENISDDANLLREQLTNFQNIQIIGGSTRLSEHFWKYDQPFYEFFKVMRLGGLTSSEIHILLNHWSDALNIKEIKTFIQNNPGQLEAIRILTGGLPRTLLFFVDLLVNRPAQNGYFYLRHIVDLYSPLYQERLNNLPPAQRLIVTKLADFWEAATTRQLQEACKMPGKTVSAQLSQLKEIGIVEVVEPTGKTFLYRISERFFNLWLIMTQGGPAQKRSAKCWTIFLENWYDEQEIKRLADEYVTGMGNKEYTGDHAALMAKALAHSKWITEVQRDLLIDNALKLDSVSDEAKTSLPQLSRTAMDEALKYLRNKQYKEALSIVIGIEQNFELKYAICAQAYTQLKMYREVITINKLHPAEDFKNAEYQSSFYWSLMVAYVQLGLYKKGITLGSKVLAANLLNTRQKIYLNKMLSICYYKIPNEKNRLKALEIISGDTEDIKPFHQEFLIKLWNGKTLDYKEVVSTISKLNPESIVINFLIHLLIHFQYSQIIKLFTGEELDLKGQENDAIYYAALKLQNTDTLAIQRIPPEFEEPVNSLVQEIIDKQKLYHPELFKGK
jgi:energy-coupling factor transporter ATP-binding protein EcfA2/DNA-binding transcriptional ArsR family regulator